MTITITQLYQALSDKFGKQEAENLTTYIEEKIKDEVAGKDVATKDFVRAQVKTSTVTILIALGTLILGLYATVITFFLNIISKIN